MPFSLAVLIKVKAIAMAFPSPSDPANIRFFPANCHGFGRALGCIVVEFEEAIFEVLPCRWHRAQGDTNFLCQGQLVRCLGQFCVQLVFEIIEA